METGSPTPIVCIVGVSRVGICIVLVCFVGVSGVNICIVSCCDGGDGEEGDGGGSDGGGNDGVEDGLHWAGAGVVSWEWYVWIVGC